MKQIHKSYKLDLRRKKVLSLYNDGLDTFEIGEILEVSKSTVLRDLKFLNKAPRGRVDYSSNSIDVGVQITICELYKSGCSFNDIVKELNVGTTAIKNTLVRHNIDVRTKSEGNSLKWEDKDFRKNQIEKRKGKPSGASGKTWKIDRIIKRPNISGKNNHFWKGGKTKVSSQIRNSVEYSFWRKQIFERDDYTCQNCGRRNKKGDKVIIEADHIYPFYKLLDDFNITNIDEAISCQELWDADNGRTLCRECHKKTDSYGANQYS